MPPSNIAFNAVNKPGFQQLLNIVEPQYQIPSKTTFSKNKVVKRYDATRESVMADLSNMAFFSSRMADMWSSHGLTSYMGYTLHWVE